MNTIVIVADSFRVDHLGCYGSQVKTPRIDEFARESAVFEHAYSEGLPTLPTRTAWWTGRFTFPFRGWQPFERDDVLLAEWLWDKGFTSALVTDVYHMHKPGFNCGRGFDSVHFIRGQEYDPWITDESIPIDLERYYRFRDEQPETFTKGPPQYLRNIAGRRTEEDWFIPQVVNKAVDWLKQHRGRDRLLLWVDCFDPHEPWDPPEPFYTMYGQPLDDWEPIDPIPGPWEGYMTEQELARVKQLYAGEVSFVDKWVGVLLDACRELGYFEDSLIIFTTDHGEPFGEHIIVRKARPWCYEELVHIPWLLRLPDGTGAGQRVEALVETCDLMPTVLDAVGVSGPEGMHGQSLLPVVRGDEEQVREWAYSGFHRGGRSIRNADWSLLTFPDRDTELYDRRSDPVEAVNVVSEHPDRAASMETELSRFVDDLLDGS